MKRTDLRNIAIIAHVDHGKTTLVDGLLSQGGTFRENQQVDTCVMDSGDLERERGITILSKNASVSYKGVKINIVDTPGHADFGGEVERVLGMVSGVLLLVDAAEGPMPQTRFVLSKALELGLAVIAVVNKVDKPDARVHEVVDEVLELMLDLGASDEQLDAPMVFCSGRAGTSSFSPDEQGKDLSCLFDTILEYIPCPDLDAEGPLQVLVSTVDYNEFVGRTAVGRIERGQMKVNQPVEVCDFHNPDVHLKGKITAIYQFEGISRTSVQEAKAGDIVMFSGIDAITIGNTLCDPAQVEPIEFVKISEPTVEMTFQVNDSPFAGREGKFVTSRQIRDRLYRELLKDVSLRVEDGASTDSFRVLGRGEMHLSILIETMRREGYEFAVGAPRALMHEENGILMEPFETAVIDVPADAVGSVIEKLGSRKGDLVSMNPIGERMKIEFLIPSRGLFGYRSEFMTDTKGEGIIGTIFAGYDAYRGEIVSRQSGSLISYETGEAVTYGLYNAQERGDLFIGAGTPVYAGMVVGASPKAEDIVVNVCKKKHVTNMRASGSDEALRLVPPRKMSLEACIEFIADDELLEVTPKSLRIRKRELSHDQRMKKLKGGK
ncbi:MAG: translational GTPase TypA [Oscillospiraceae bacterium]|nr:translational GTPase TypA [Oscillospiraceae bacterium]MCM0705433.1 translational GTPase TypA [Faecalicatena sp. BF-R-105]MDY3220005.1 translational GTPase TypA [Candidatus Fimivivens sp.]SFI81315.1 GTP-binding protein [Ruminococcaceae bacterium D5]GKH48992.1 GTP-binding protein [Eubacteriales bacterium]